MARALLLALVAALSTPALSAAPAAPPAAPTARPRFTWPNPDMIESVEVPGTMKALGVPMKLKAIRVRRHMDELVDTYVAAFEQAGFYIPPDRHQVQRTRELTLVALDTRRLIAYTVIFQPNRDGTTTLVLGESNLARLERPGPGRFAVYPGATGMIRSDQEGAQVLLYAAKAKPEEVLAFHRQELGKAGFTERNPAEPGIFTHGAEQVQLLTRPRADGQLSVTLLHRTGPAEGDSRLDER